MKYELNIGRPDAGRKIERVAAALLDSAPFSLVRRLLRNGKIRINGTKAKGGELVAEGDVVTIHHAAPGRAPKAKPEASPGYKGPPLTQLYRSEEYLALNKPAGVSCSEDDRPRESVQAWLRDSLAEEIEDGSVRPELCHRLDRGTSGVVLVALSASAVTHFHEASAAGEVEKIYSVLAWGRVPSERFTVNRALRRKPDVRADQPKVVPARAASLDAQEAITEFRALSQGDHACLLWARLETGRTHQIRAHLRAEGFALAGDLRYGDSRRDREEGILKILDHPALHAEELSFPDAGSRQTVRAPRPPEFMAAMRRLKIEPR